MKGYWILSKAFSISIERIMWFFFLDSIFVLHYIYWFSCIEPLLHPWNTTNLIMAF
jgi:hypothetical protein